MCVTRPSVLNDHSGYSVHSALSERDRKSDVQPRFIFGPRFYYGLRKTLIIVVDYLRTGSSYIAIYASLQIFY